MGADEIKEMYYYKMYVVYTYFIYFYVPLIVYGNRFEEKRGLQMVSVVSRVKLQVQFPNIETR
jgi:hypothetical protein